MQNEKLRNVAIIAHVDHGKTTLVDQMLKQGGVYRENQETVERVMDSNDLERERGITILAKNTAIQYGDTKINIVDTPGHADFGGEVERILKMVNGVILLVDAAEGPMPQTRFVLSRALELGHRVIVVVNKIDRPDQRIHEVVDEVLELLMDLDATPEQLDSPMLFCSGRNGTASYSPDVPGTDLKPLFETILEYIPAPEADVDQPFQMLVSSIDYNDFVGRIAIGRIERGTLKQNQDIVVCNYHDPEAVLRKARATAIYEFEGLARNPVTESTAGNIIAMSGIGDMNAWQLAAIALVAVGVVALGVTEATEDDELRAARQQASNHKYAKSLLALLLPIAYCILDAAGTFADSLVLETLSEDSANVAYELTFLVAGLLCGAYVLFVKHEKLTPRTEAPKYVGAVCETIGQFFYIYALADSAHVAMSAPIISSYCAASVLWSRIFLKEKLSVKHYISILMVFIGIVIMGVFDM